MTHVHFKTTRLMAVLAMLAACTVVPATVLGQPAQPLPVPAAEEDDLIREIVEPTGTLVLQPNRSKVIRTNSPIFRAAVADPSIADITQYGPREFELIGRRTGQTTLTFWYGEAEEDGALQSYLVKVESDDTEQELAKTEYDKLQSQLNELFPNSQVQLFPVADKLIVRGQARDAAEAAEIMSILRNRTGSSRTQLNNPISAGQASRIPGAEELPTSSVISLLRVAGEQQVMLKVRIAEISRTALREAGLDFAGVRGKFDVSNMIGGPGNITAIFDSDELGLFIKAFSSNGNSRILAEPTLITVSGKPATFLAGGEFAVPTAVGVGGIAAASTTFRGFGTQLSFLPTVLDKDHVRLQVNPTFSSLNQENAVDGIPGLNIRTVDTTVDLREGQWLAIAGLIQDEQSGSQRRVPFLGDIPVVRLAFSTEKVEHDETELLVLVSPELVSPLEPDHAPLLLPGMNVTEPTDVDFYLHRQIEGRPDLHHRSTVWPVQAERIRQAKHAARVDARAATTGRPALMQGQDYYLHGPHGFSN